MSTVRVLDKEEEMGKSVVKAVVAMGVVRPKVLEQADREQREKEEAAAARADARERANMTPPPPLPTLTERLEWGTLAIKSLAKREGRRGDPSWSKKWAGLVEDAERSLKEVQDAEKALRALPAPVAVLKEAAKPVVERIAKCFGISVEEAEAFARSSLPLIEARAEFGRATHAQQLADRRLDKAVNACWAVIERAASLRIGDGNTQPWCAEDVVSFGRQLAE